MAKGKNRGGARNKDGVYRVCFNDELFKLETSDSTKPITVLGLARLGT